MKTKWLKTGFITLGIASIVSCTPSLNKMTLLRSPEKLSHSFEYSSVRENEFLEFKGKLKSFASKISECFVKREYDSTKNIVVSPLSIELCLGLAVRSSNGQTRQEILDSMGVDYETFNKYYKLYYNHFLLDIKDEDNKVVSKLSLTNSIWFDNDLRLVEGGLDALKDDYYCYSYEVDFNGDNKKTNKAIQEFINEQTNGLINPQLNLSEDVLFALMNTLYLKDLWNSMGIDLSYADNSYQFTNANGNKSNKNLLMGSYKLGKVLNKDNYSCFYTETNRGFRIYFIKPNEGKKINDIFTNSLINEAINDKNYINVDDVLHEMYYTRCFFPEYEAYSEVSLNDMLLYDFNVKCLFDKSLCDYSNVSYDRAYCDSVQHYAKLKVDKKGVEGAAVTIMANEATSGMPDDYKRVYDDFIVDKEFGYVLTFKDNDILFSGITSNID